MVVAGTNPQFPNTFLVHTVLYQASSVPCRYKGPGHCSAAAACLKCLQRSPRRHFEQKFLMVEACSCHFDRFQQQAATRTFLMFAPAASRGASAWRVLSASRKSRSPNRSTDCGTHHIHGVSKQGTAAGDRCSRQPLACSPQPRE